MSVILRKYATATTTNGKDVGIPMVKAGVADLAVSADWTPAAGDVKVSIDAGAQANIGTLPSYTNGQWVFTLTAGEMTGKTIRIAIVDTAPKAVEDQFFVIETFGHASAMYQVDYSAAKLPATVAAGDGADAADVKAAVALIAAGTTIIRANDSAGGAIATAAGLATAVSTLGSAIANVQNNTFVSTNIPTTLERPDAGSDTIPIVVVIADEQGNAANLDAAATPTTVIVNEAGTSRAGRLSGWANPSTGKFTATFTRNVTDPIELLAWEITGTINGKLRRYVTSMQIVDTTAISFTSTDRTTLGTINTTLAAMRTTYTDVRAGKLDNLDTNVGSRMATFAYTTPDNTTISSMAAALADMRTHFTNARGDKLDNLDAAMTSRMATFAYTAPLSSAQTRDAVWNVNAGFAFAVDSMGEALAQAAGLIYTWSQTGDVGEAAARIVGITELFDATQGGTISLPDGAPEMYYRFLDQANFPTTTAQTLRNYNRIDAQLSGVAPDAAAFVWSYTDAPRTLSDEGNVDVATAVELAIINEGDTRPVIAAMVAAIEAADLDLGGVTISAIATAVVNSMQAGGTKLSVIHGKLPAGNIADGATLATAIGTPMQAGSYVAPNNAGIASILTIAGSFTFNSGNRVVAYLAAAAPGVIPTPPTVGEIDAQLSGAHGSGDWSATGGGDGEANGDGDIIVSSSNEADDDLRVTGHDGAGVDNVMVEAIRTTDYQNRLFVVRDRTYTDADGRFGMLNGTAPLKLNALQYTLLFSKPGVIVSTTRTITVE